MPGGNPFSSLLRLRILFALLSLAVAATASLAEQIRATPENYRERVRSLKPGDTLELAAGEYKEGLAIHRLAGTARAPIVIRGPKQGKAAIFLARRGANTISIVDSAHVHISNLVLDGRGIPVDAVKAEGHASFAHHITLENLTIVNHGASQQTVGISTKCPAWNWIIRANRIYGAGTGIYLGDSDGSDPFYAGTIENNLVTGSLGYAIQIKHQHARPALATAPRGRHVTVIRHNVLSKAVGGSSGQLARPNLLLGHWPLSGEGAEDLYLVYGNFIAANPHEALIQAEGNVAIYNNVLSNPHGPGIVIQPHNDVPRDVRILFNTIATAVDPIVVRIRDEPSVHAQVIAHNVVASQWPIVGGWQYHNVVLDGEAIATQLAAMEPGRALDLRPTGDELSCPPIDTSLIAGLPEAQCDFHGRPRNGDYCGAYARGGNPGWLPSLTVKPATACAVR